MEKLADIIIEHFWAMSATILGSAFIGYIAYRNNRINRFNDAAQKFTNTFHQELKEIYPNPINWPESIDYYLRERFDNLNSAVTDFKGHLPWYKRKGFINAWCRYYNATGREIDNENCQCYLHYIPMSGTGFENGNQTFHDNTQTYKQDFKNNVEVILKYAKLQ